MIYTYSLLGFILYDITIKFIEVTNIKLNKYKPIFQYVTIQENNNNNFINFDIFCVFLLFLPVILQNIIMGLYVSYIINKLYNVYFTERKTNQYVYIKTPNTILGIFLTLNTIIYTFNNPNEQNIYYGILNVICIYLLTNSYTSTIIT
jgi:hypothetical protein